MEKTQIQGPSITVDSAEGPNHLGQTVSMKFGLIPPEPGKKVDVRGWTCTTAKGTYTPPTTSVVQVFLQNTTTKEWIPGTVTSSKGGFWTGVFPEQPPGTYLVMAVGNAPTSEPGFSSAFPCPLP